MMSSEYKRLIQGKYVLGIIDCDDGFTHIHFDDCVLIVDIKSWSPILERVEKPFTLEKEYREDTW